jgi:glycosyltransferase involved in cell wall biosynthesis
VSRVLLSAYACEPGRGSEPGVGWSWATELAGLGHHVTVVTRTANLRAIEQATRPMKTLRFIYYDLPSWLQRRRKWRGGKAFYYILWQWFAVRQIRLLYPSLPFDVVQHVTYVSARYPSFLGSLGIPFLFGPVSGGESVPPTLRAGFSAGQRWREWLRDISNFFVTLDPLMRRTFRQAERILVTRDTAKLVPQRWRHKCTVRLAVGLAEQSLTSTDYWPKRNRNDLRLLYVGRLLEWKGVHIALRAVREARQVYPDIRFTIVGIGPANEKLVALSHELGLDRIVRWVSWLPQTALIEHYREADLLLFPSLRDSGGQVVLEALAHGVPVICTDLGGPGLIVNENCGRVLLTADRNTQQLASDMAAAVIEVALVPNILESLSYGARARVHEFNFQELVESVYPRPLARAPRQVWQAHCH